MADKAKIAVLGASGYTGAELVRLLLRHPRAEIVLLTADRRAGQEMRAVFPQFAPFNLPKLVAIESVDWKSAGIALAFCALPHGNDADRHQGSDDESAEDESRRSFGRFPAAR